jgi:hypothetical protein
LVLPEKGVENVANLFQFEGSFSILDFPRDAKEGSLGQGKNPHVA